jgi:hypothetical protein
VLRLALLLVVLAIAAPAAQAANVTLTLTSVTAVTQTHDAKPKGVVSKGDSIDFKDLLLATQDNQLGKKKGKPVGYDAGTVVYTSKTATSISGVTTFPGYGTLSFAGPMVTRKDGTVHVPVTKGTGTFKGAKGMLVIGTGDNKAPNTYVLTMPHALCQGACA